METGSFDAKGRAGVSVRPLGDVACVTLDDGRGNTLGSATLAALGAALGEASAAAAVLLVGRARIFSGGLDLREIAHLPRAALLDFLDLLHDTRRALFALPRPLVVAARGSALGAGAALLCCGDTRLGARDAGLVGFPEVALGVPVPASALEIALAALTPLAAARALLFGASFAREEAVAMGFFHGLAEPAELLAEAEQAARGAAGLSTAAGAIKQALRRAALRRMDDDRAASHEAFAAAWTSPEAQRRIQAVLHRLAARGERPASS
jgi:enoyl-CoA hydratase